MMQAWVDDSGVKGGETHLTLAGFIGEAEQWADFPNRWDSALAATPRIEVFKMEHAANFKGEFARLSRPEINGKVRLVASVIDEFALTLVHCTIDLQAFEDIFPKFDSGSPKGLWKKLRTFSHPYFFALHNICTMVCLELRDRNIENQFEMIFDEHVIMRPRVEEWYPAYCAHFDPQERAIMPSDLSWRDDKAFVQLQAADLMAWPIRRHFSGLENPFSWLGEAMPSTKVSKYARYYDRAYFTELAKRAEALGDQPLDPEFLSILRDFFGSPVA